MDSDGETKPLLSVVAEKPPKSAGEKANADKRRKSKGDTNKVTSDDGNVVSENSNSNKRRKSKGDTNKVTSDDGNVVRRPIQYYCINNESRNPSRPAHPTDHDHDTVAVVSRYKYFNKLSRHGDTTLHMPDHVVPSHFFARILIPIQGEQSSLITIFALWNTMMGTSLLSMPWAIKQAGFTTGLTLIVAMAGLMLYTSYRVMTSVRSIDAGGEILEFSDVCRHYLGRWAEVCSVIFSLVTLLGGMIVYWILMSNFLYNDVKFIYNKVHDEVNSSSALTPKNYSQYSDAYCPHPPYSWWKNITAPNETLLSSGELGESESTRIFHQVWDAQKTVPFFLIIVLAPLLNFKSPTFFTKFNMLGTVSVAYIVTFVTVKAAHWGFHLDFTSETQPLYVPQFKKTFPALTGVAALAYFIQNCVLSLTRNQKNPQNNARDLTLAYVLVCATYFYVGMMMYASFPLAKGCIEDNLLNNFQSSDVMAFVARICLFVQMTAVFPLLGYVFRVQIMHTLFGSVWPSLKHILVLNVILMAVCVVFARFLPHIGTIISFVGAFCGFAYAIALPCSVYMLSLREKGQLTLLSVTIHSLLIVFGLFNFIAQFLILGKT